MSESRASSEVPQRRLLPVADHSLLIECPDLADAVAVHAALSEQGFRGVGGASTVLLGDDAVTAPAAGSSHQTGRPCVSTSHDR